MLPFLERINERLEKDRQLTHATYSDLRRMGAFRAVTVRLPVTTIAKMKLLEETCPKVWESRQEMLFEMIESCILEWIENAPFPDGDHDKFQQAALTALQQGPQKHGKETLGDEL
jgi:hypothetical protein